MGLFRSRFLNNGYFLFFDFVLLGCLDLESFGFFFVMLVWQEIEGLMNLVNVVFWIKGEILVLFVCELCCIVVAYWWWLMLVDISWFGAKFEMFLLWNWCWFLFKVWCFVLNLYFEQWKFLKPNWIRLFNWLNLSREPTLYTCSLFEWFYQIGDVPVSELVLIFVYGLIFCIEYVFWSMFYKPNRSWTMNQHCLGLVIWAIRSRFCPD